MPTVIGACPHDCPDTCSMLFDVEDDKVVGVRGNPDHPYTQGRLCVKVNDYEKRVHSPDRILHPLRRIGRKGEGRFERVSWDEAVTTIADRFRGIIDQEGPQAILPFSYLGTEGIINGLNVGDPFFNKLGATIAERTFCDSGSSTAYAMTIGDTGGTDPESFVHSKYIILWACNTLSTNAHHWPFIKAAMKNGAKLVVIDPMRSRTAREADWHIPIKPGTDAALALAMIHTIIDEGLVDQDYVDNYTVGFAELAERAAEYTPEMAEIHTGVSADDIRTLARAYAETQPSVIRIGVAIERHSGGGQAVRAIACLPALVGAWRRPGGGLLQLPVWLFPVDWGNLMRPDFIDGEPRVLNLWRLGRALTGELPLDPPIKALMVYNGNPLTTVADQAKVMHGLARDDLFTVVSEQFMTDTARYADIVLPATTQAEQADIMFSWGHFYLSYNNPAIAPLGEAVTNTELFRRLAKAMGFNDPYFQQSDEEKIAASMLWDSPVMQGIDLARLKKDGFARLNLGSPDSYAPHAEGGFNTPSGKCELKSSAAAGGNFVIPLFRQGYDGQQSGEPVDPLPHFIPPRESAQANPTLAEKCPLNIISPKSHAFLNSSYANMPKQLKSAGGRSRVMIHPTDAAARDIRDGQTIRVFNDRGGFEAAAEVTDNVMTGVVVSPFGFWCNGTDAAATVQAVNASRLADLGAAPTFSDTLVEVEPAG